MNETFTISDEDKPTVLTLAGVVRLTSNLRQSVGSCCGVVNKWVHNQSRYSKYIHVFMSPPDTIENSTRQSLLIPDHTGNLLIEWDDV
jgi:hypothetical protein